MSRLKAGIVVALSVALWTPLRVTAQDSSENPTVDLRAHREALRLVDAWLESEQVYRRIPSLSAAVVQGDKNVYSKGYGTLDAEHKLPATAQTLYSICSISKLFTSVALMQLWEADRVIWMNR